MGSKKEQKKIVPAACSIKNRGETGICVYIITTLPTLIYNLIWI